MAATTQIPPLNRHITCSATAKPPRPKLACFSFAAYAKAVIDHLKSLQIPVLAGLSDPEFTSLESTFRFSFPPDLRSILQEGLPVGAGFPNWRSSSLQQLHILINLPKFCLLKEISQRNFWPKSWGARPDHPNDAVSFAKRFLENVPVLCPIYRNCYIPSVPNVAGNPVFLVGGGEIRVLSFDLAGFFQNHRQYSQLGEHDSRISSPAWAATEARAVEFWTEVASGKGATAAAGAGRGWWSEGNYEMGLDGCLEEVFWKLREGGWREDDVRDMMMMDGRDQIIEQCGPTIDKRRVCEMLLSGGWSREDVVYSLDLEDSSAKAIPEEESTFEINLHKPTRSAHVERKKRPSKTTNNVQMAPFFFAPYRNLIL